MPMVLRIVIVSVISLLSFLTANAQGAFPTNEDLRHFRVINDPRLSPDGHMALYRITESTSDGGRSHLWITDIETKQSRQLTFDPTGTKLEGYRGENSGEWMPDGSAILFLAKRGEHTQLYRLPMHGGEAQLFDLKVVPFATASQIAAAIQTSKSSGKPEETTEPQVIDVTRYAIAPDGKTIAIIGNDPETLAEEKQKKDKADATWVNHDLHGTRLFLLDPATAKLTRTAAPPHVQSVTWSPDSSQLLVVTEAPNGASDLGPARKAYLLSGNAPDKMNDVKELPPTVDAVAWSKDGHSIFFHGQAANDTPPGYNDIYALDLQARSIHNFTREFSGSVEHEPPVPLKGGGVLQSIATGVRTTALLATGGSSTTTLTFPTSLAGSFQTNANQSGWLFIAASSTQPLTMYYATDLNQTARTLNIPALVPQNSRSVESKLIRWKSDQFTIEGLLYLPPTSAPQRVPMIVDVHGGPSGAWQDGYDPFVGYLTGQGWAVFRPNIRGSSNYGAAFVAANKNDLGGGDYRDLMAGVDYIMKNYPIDPDRLGLFGYSYGGEMAGFVEGKTNRFKAIVSGAPVIDQYSEYGTEKESWYDRWYFGKPWERTADAWRQSPLSGAGHASTPFLLLQGEADKTDPLGQSQEIYRALRQMGVPVELVIYPREDHGPLIRSIVGFPSTEPWHGSDARKRIVDFFQKAFAAGR
ncbi:MAG: prolyl oligopeptidase family serine peptidase [Terriglobales bacterium]